MSTDTTHLPSPARAATGLPWAGYLLGFALGGFFDGILLHQVLQWHHLLSAVESSAVRDIRVQILADGLFHAAMYVVAAVGCGCCGGAGAASPNRGRTVSSSPTR
nr:DUF2243 domain-containing protein [Azospirillum brasilense]